MDRVPLAEKDSLQWSLMVWLKLAETVSRLNNEPTILGAIV